VKLLVLGFLIAAVVYLVTGGHLLFLPLLLVLPLGGALFGSRRRERRRGWW
jgi:hypothetical protein